MKHNVDTSATGQEVYGVSDTVTWLAPAIAVVTGALSGYVSARIAFRNEVITRLDEELSKSRAAAYKDLWPRLLPLARFDRPSELTTQVLANVSQDLATWYFTAEYGGMYLSNAANESYMHLKEVLRDIAECPPEALEERAKVALQAASALRHELRHDLGAGSPLLFRRRRPRDLRR